MGYYIGIDVACKDSRIAIIDEKGRIAKQGKCPTTVQDFHVFIKRTKFPVQAIGLETGTECHHLARGLEKLGYKVHLMEARKSAKLIEAFKRNKNDKNDALALAKILRANLQESVRIKETKQTDRLALVSTRRRLVDTRTAMTNQIRSLAKVQGLKRKGGFVAEAWSEFIRDSEVISDLLKSSLLSLIEVVKKLDEEIENMDLKLKEILKSDEEARRLERIPGVGPVLAVTYLAHIDSNRTFTRSRDVGAFLGMTSREFSSGQKVRRGRISKRGPNELRRLFKIAGMNVIESQKNDSPLRRWALLLAKKIGKGKAALAVGRKLAIIMYRMLRTGEDYDANYAEQKDCLKEAA